MNLELIENPDTRTVTGKVTWPDGAKMDLGSRSSDKYTEVLRSSTKVRTGLLPPAVRWLSGDRRVVVFERPPCYQKVSFYAVRRDQIASVLVTEEQYKKAGKDPGRYKLQEYIIPVPWLVYLVGFGLDCQPVTVRVYMRPTPLESLGDQVFLFPMLNFYSNSKLCQPIFEKYEEKDATIAEGLQSAYNTVWNSGFNYDLQDAAKVGYQQSSPCKAVKSAYTSGDFVQSLLAAWSRQSVPSVLSGRMVPPGVQSDDVNNTSPHPVTLENVIKIVTHELFHDHMGSKNLTKNFITSLVNNFNLCPT